MQFYKWVGLFVGPSVDPSVGPLERMLFFFVSAKMGKIVSKCRKRDIDASGLCAETL